MTGDLVALALRPRRGLLWSAIGAAVLAAGASVWLLAISGWFLTGAALAGAGGMAAVWAFNYLLPSAGIRGLAIVRTLARYGERLLAHQAALLAFADLRPRLFARLAAASPADPARPGGGAIAAHLGGDVEALEDLAVRKVAIGGALAGAAAGIAGALLAGPIPALVLAAGLALSLLLTGALAPRLLTAPHRAHGAALQSLKALYAEYADCGVELAIYGRTDHAAAILARKALAVDAACRAIARREALLQALHLVAGSITIAAMLIATHAPLPLAALAALAGAGAFEAWGGLTQSLLQRARVSAALGRLAQITALEPRPASAPLPAGAGSELSFGWNGQTALVRPGERIRLTGPSGCGKSRLAETLVGLRADAPQGIAIGGRPVSDIGLDHLRRLFALSAQDAPLIAGTVADNLRFARPDVTEADMWAALATACLAETVRALPQALDTWLGSASARLSGGQRKRLSLARALLADKPWLVLDEPSEGLDLATERQLCANLDMWLQETGTGLILINHRPGLDRLAQRCLALQAVSPVA